MKNAVSFNCILVSALTIGGCSSVPDVETRLQSMQLHSNMYVVQAGETVESIAYRYQLSIAELEAINPGLSSSITAGLRINVRPGTLLSADVRTRASYAPARQPQLVSARSSNRVRAPQQRVTVASNNVPVAPISVNPEIRMQHESTVPPSDTQITEIPATSWSNEEVIVEQGTFTEEVIPDTLDYAPVQGARVVMDQELAQYVGKWSWPTDGQVAREFAPNEVGGHGVDIAGVPGQHVRAAMAGTVVYSGRDLSDGGGNLIIVKHSDNLMTTYSHTDQLFVAEDDQVAAGDPIASLGWNANRESVLRFEVREDGNPLDPMNFLPLR